MNHTIDPSRLKELRTRSGLSQGALGEKAEIDKQTIHRIEAGHQQAVRTSTVEKLADALGVGREVLTGQAPLPEVDLVSVRARPSNDDDYSINVPVDGAIRNAFSLVQMRYRVPVARIVELAPFLFVLAAEASLARRAAKLAAIRNVFEQAESLLMELPYLGTSVLPDTRYLDAEHRSIADRDVWGERLLDYAGGFDRVDCYNERQYNPFVLHLKEACPTEAGVAEIHDFDRSSIEFDVCYQDALKLTGGDEELANGIVNGEIMLHKMPRELFNNDAADARISWLREKRDAHRAEQAALEAYNDYDLF
jgi:transcriptional regulator with XRE-family HTH domain